MRYAVFSLTLTALFLTACADPDNPVVYTAPAGKAAVAEDEEVKQPPGPNHGSYKEVPYVPVDPPETAASHLANEPDHPPRISEVRIPPLSVKPEYQEAWDTEDPTLREAIRDEWRDEHLREANALSTISVSGEKMTEGSTHYAVFTFTRTGGHTDEPLSFQYILAQIPYPVENPSSWQRAQDSRETRITGFAAGETTYKTRARFKFGQGEVRVALVEGQGSDMSGDYIVAVGVPHYVTVTF